MEIKWEIEDEYAGPPRTQTTEIDITDFAEGMSLEDIEDEVVGLVQEDFDQNISWNVDKDKMDKLCQEIFDKTRVTGEAV